MQLHPGGVDHVLCADALRVGDGRHFRHAHLLVGGGGLRGGPLLQGPEADHEEGAVRGQAACHRLHARFMPPPVPSLRSLLLIAAAALVALLTTASLPCHCRYQDAGGARPERVRHPHAASCARRHTVRGLAEGTEEDFTVRCSSELLFCCNFTETVSYFL